MIDSCMRKNIKPISIVFNDPTSSSLSDAQISHLLKPNMQLSFRMLAIVCSILLAVITELYIHATSGLGQLRTDVETKGKLIAGIQQMNNHMMEANKALDDLIKDLIKERI